MLIYEEAKDRGTIISLVLVMRKLTVIISGRMFQHKDTAWCQQSVLKDQPWQFIDTGECIRGASKNKIERVRTLGHKSEYIGANNSKTG